MRTPAIDTARHEVLQGQSLLEVGVDLRRVPEVGGPIDPANEAHDLIMSVFGGLSKGERNRVKVRVRTAMAAQIQIESRFLGGRRPIATPRGRRAAPQPIQGR